MWLEFEGIALVVVFSQSLCHFHTRMVDALSHIGSRKQVTISLPSFQKTMVTRSIEQEIRNKNFGARKTGIFRQKPWSRIRGQNSVNKELLEIVGNGKPTEGVQLQFPSRYP